MYKTKFRIYYWNDNSNKSDLYKIISQNYCSELAKLTNLTENNSFGMYENRIPYFEFTFTLSEIESLENNLDTTMFVL